MRTSLAIAAHNEGDRLWQTVRACVEGCADLDYEILIADDASFDGSVERTLQRFPQARLVRHDERQGASPTKALGAAQARGDVLVFQDGHCNPEPGAIERLVENVEALDGESVVTPAIPSLCTERWKNLPGQVGHGYRVGLEQLDCGWLPLDALRPAKFGLRRLYESPALIGCAFAVSRELYDKLWGFDRQMFAWGVEDLDFGLKCWLMGHSILHDPEAVIGHRFRKSFDNFDVPAERVLVNQLRMARKQFAPGVWSEWLDRCRQRHQGRLAGHPEGLWARAWTLFEEHRASAEQERAYLQSRRTRDEFWYADRFGLSWPRLQSKAVSNPAPALPARLQTEPSPSPPPTCGKPAEIDCPPEQPAWASMMDKRHWYHFNDGNRPWDWIDAGSDVWRVRVQDPRPAKQNRHKYDLMTYCCFSDFNLKFDFRCPDVRAMWDQCADPLLGIRNWGNSGVYIFNSYEIQIHDSYKGPDSAPDTTVPADGTISLRIDPSAGTGPSCDIATTELCGAVYKTRAPNVNLVKKAVGDPPTGDWNTMEIGFMSPRYDAAGTKVKHATVTVKINTTDPAQAAFVAFGIANKTGRFNEGHWGKTDDNRYGQGWKKDVGPIVLQEHDNYVEFRDIQINPAWYPALDGGVFDRCWQRPKFGDCE